MPAKDVTAYNAHNPVSLTGIAEIPLSSSFLIESRMLSFGFTVTTFEDIMVLSLAS